MATNPPFDIGQFERDGFAFGRACLSHEELEALRDCFDRRLRQRGPEMEIDLGMDWRAGAEWFQWALADFDVVRLHNKRRWPHL